MALDKQPRRFVLTVSEVDINVNPKDGHDKIVIEVKGRVLPSTKKRLDKALRQGFVELHTKVMM